VKPPLNRQGEWNDLLADYDRHCHDVIQLDSKRFDVRSAVGLFDAHDARRYRANLTPPAEFSDAGLHEFSEVYFNRNPHPRPGVSRYVLWQYVRKLEMGRAGARQQSMGDPAMGVY
jgi:hypothetical protein